MSDGFWNWWQHLPGRMDPVLFEIGSFKLQYYGLMYILAFAIAYGLVLYRIRHENRFAISRGQVESLMVNAMFGLIIGARLGYVLFYNLSYYLHHPLEIILPFELSNGFRFVGITGMSYHGGLIGVIFATGLYVRRAGLDFWEMSDLFVPVVPIGYTFGRVGNFINGELFGRATSTPLGMYFPMAPGFDPRHPSQLYEAFFEGVFLFMILWVLRQRVQTRGAMIAFYLFGYGAVRFMIEFFREPDAHIGFILSSFSTGQVLCSLMILSGALLYLYRRWETVRGLRD